MAKGFDQQDERGREGGGPPPSPVGRKGSDSPKRFDPLNGERAIAAKAHSQKGLITWRDLRAIGLSRAAIADRVDRGRLTRVHHGVYTYGHRHLRREGVYLAAVLACGEGAALSHRSAGGHHDLRPDNRARIDVTVPRRGGHARPGIDIHRSGTLTPVDVEVVDGVPCTTWSRTIVDLADVVPQHHVAKVLDRAEELQLMDVPTLLDALTRAGRRRGRGRLLGALRAYDPDGALLRSWLEERLLALVAAAGLPKPLVNHHVLTYEVDLHWPDRRLIVEADSWRHHGRRRAFRDDRARDRALQLAGWRPLRFTYADIVDTPRSVAVQIATALTDPGPEGEPQGHPRKSPGGRPYCAPRAPVV